MNVLKYGVEAPHRIFYFADSEKTISFAVILCYNIFCIGIFDPPNLILAGRLKHEYGK